MLPLELILSRLREHGHKVVNRDVVCAFAEYLLYRLGF